LNPFWRSGGFGGISTAFARLDATLISSSSFSSIPSSFGGIRAFALFLLSSLSLSSSFSRSNPVCLSLSSKVFSAGISLKNPG